MPTHIVCLRHGEEPASAIDQWGPGFNAFGHCSENGLSIRGWQRAGGLAATHVCGCVPHKALTSSLDIFVPRYDADPEHHRAGLTMTPFARRINAKLRGDRDKEDVLGLAADVLAVKGVAVVCWEHKNLALLVDWLVNNVKPHHDKDAPSRLAWPKGRYDLVWVLSSSTGGKPFAMESVPELLLPGDEGAARYRREPPVASLH